MTLFAATHHPSFTHRRVPLAVIALLALATVSSAATAKFIAQDDQTKGDWEHAYGADGAVIAGVVSKLPGYAAVAETGDVFRYEDDSQDPRAMYKPDEDGRIACSRYAPDFAWELNINDGPKRVAIYLMDFNRKGRTQKLEVVDAASNAVLDSRPITAFAEGRYLVYDLAGKIRLHFTGDGANPAVVNGLFFGKPLRPDGPRKPKPLPPPPTEPGFWKQRFVASVGGKNLAVPFVVYLPVDYAKSKDRYPMVVFLHGIGECGTNLEAVFSHGPGRLLKENEAYRNSSRFMVLIPQCTNGWNADGVSTAVLQLIDYAGKQWRVDADRVSITGLSNGGLGTWMVAEEGAERFAVVMPMDPFACKPEVAAQKLSKATTWIVVGDSDGDHTTGSKQMYATLKPTGADVYLTVVPNCGHGAWDRYYYRTEVWDWVLGHSRGGKPLPLPACGINPPK